MENITDKKKAILESTLELIKENGFHGTPMSMVAKKAGVAAGTIYHYFDSKNTLICNLYCHVKNQIVEVIFKDDDPAMAFKDRFLHFWMNYYDFYIHHPNALFFMEQFVNSPYNTRDPQKENENFQNVIFSFFRNGVVDGALKQMDYRLLAAIVHGTLITTSKIHLSNRLPLGETELQQVAEMVWDGIENKQS